MKRFLTPPPPPASLNFDKTGDRESQTQAAVFRCPAASRGVLESTAGALSSLRMPFCQKGLTRMILTGIIILPVERNILPGPRTLAWLTAKYVIF